MNDIITTNNFSGLKRHKTKVHSNIRPFSCAQCSQTFAFQYDLNKHTKQKSCVRKGNTAKKRQRNGKPVPTDPLECSAAEKSSNENAAVKLPNLAPKLTRVLDNNSCLSNIVLPENVVVFTEENNLNFKD